MMIVKKLQTMMGTYRGQVNKNNKPHGKGVYVFSKKSKYEGMFKNGNIHGKGVFIYSNGSKHVGEFKSNFADGKGIRYLKNGKVLKGIWKEGELLHKNKLKRKFKKMTK